MKSCTFFGHRNISCQIEEILTSFLINLIEKNDVSIFYIGTQGDFDAIVLRILKLLKFKYPYISYYIVLAYLPCTQNSPYNNHSKNTIYPEGLETVPPKYAIPKRNQWMINKSDYVIVYVNQPFSNAFKFKEISEKKGKTVINIADFCF